MERKYCDRDENTCLGFVFPGKTDSRMQPRNDRETRIFCLKWLGCSGYCTLMYCLWVTCSYKFSLYCHQFLIDGVRKWKMCIGVSCFPDEVCVSDYFEVVQIFRMQSFFFKVMGGYWLHICDSNYYWWYIYPIPMGENNIWFVIVQNVDKYLHVYL